jgi:hypothetical protein
MDNKYGYDRRSNLSKTGQMTLGNKKPFDTINNQIVKGYNDRNASRGEKNIGTNMKFERHEINDAKESLRLLKQKVTSTNTMNKFSGLSNTLGGLNSNVNMNVPYTSHDTRKFKPNLYSTDQEEISKINSNTFKPNNYSTKNGGSNYSSNSGNKFNYNNKPSVESKIDKSKINPIFNQPPMRNNNNNRRTNNIQVEEVEDNRPAVAGSNLGNGEPEVLEEEPGDLQECHGCGRKFREEAFQKHAKACKKVFQSKRKAFDSKKKRIIDSEHAMIQKQGEYEEKTNPKLKQIKQKKNVNWKKQSEMLRNVAAANRTDEDFSKQHPGNVVQVTGKKNVGYTQDDDLTPCNLCGRRYNEEAYKRHLNHCEKKDRDNKMKGKSSNNALRQNLPSSNSKPNLNTKFPGKK